MLHQPPQVFVVVGMASVFGAAASTDCNHADGRRAITCGYRRAVVKRERSSWESEWKCELTVEGS